MNLYEMAEQCNCWIEDTGNLVTDDINLKAFADLVRAAEREKVAKQWEQWHGFDKHTVAAFIRARGETK